MPFEALGALTLNSPVEGLYKYWALLVKIVVGTPLVADANKGKRLLAVVVSLLIVAPAVPFAAAVIRPFALTVMFAAVNEPTLELTVASVPAAVTLADPSKDGLV